MPFHMYSYCSASPFCATYALIGGVLIELTFLEAKFEAHFAFLEKEEPVQSRSVAFFLPFLDQPMIQ